MSDDECTLRSTIDKSVAFRLVRLSETAQSVTAQVHTSTSEYQLIESLVDQRILLCKHSFRPSSIEVGRTSRHRSAQFRRLVEAYPNVHFLFHGTKEDNHESIFSNGFNLEEHRGETDLGYIGKGVYLSPIPEYSASYIKDTPGINRHKYENPVNEGVTCKLLGCLTYVGRTRRLYTKDYNSEIEDALDSRWAWVKKDGNIADKTDRQFAVEYVIKQSISVVPAVRISLHRVSREVVWVDPNIRNAENSGYVRELKQSKSIFIFASTSVTHGLYALKRKKDGTRYRAITSGTGGEELVRKLRTELSISCKVMVFCRSVEYHQTWARKYENVKVTSSAEKMKRFATFATE